ncbi:MAG: response regulator [Oscillospiraceae bacterium]|nr:response regulator [Oscillospiraceae bacterium]
MNLKVLIVDDEKLDREGLSRQLDWEKYSIVDVFLEKNGPAALESIRRNDIDILLTDMKMPAMSGIELAQHARQINPSVKIIFISGHDDFEYMKSAIQLNAYEYLLKPVQTDDLAACIAGVVNSIQTERQEQNERSKLIRMANVGLPLLRQRLMLDLLFGIGNQFEDRMNELNVPLATGLMAVLLVEIDDRQASPEENERKTGELLKIICSLPARDPYGLESVRIEGGRLAVLVNARIHMPLQEMERVIIDLAEELLGLMTPFCSVTIGIGDVVENYRGLNGSYSQSVQAVLSKLYNGKGKVLRFAGDPTEDADNNLQTIDYEIADCLTKLDWAKATYLLDYMFDYFEQRKGSDPYAIQYHCINIISRMEITLRDLNVQAESLFGRKINLIEKLLKFETILDIRQWMKNIVHISIQHLDVRRKSHAGIIAGEVIRVVEAKYKEDISLNVIAKSLFYTPNYLGSVFKQETGRYFSEYLTEYRIEKAAEMLRGRKIKVLEAALSVGYRDMPTFIKNFKSIHGVTPSEYRARRIP